MPIDKIDRYSFSWTERDEEGSWYTVWDSCVASSLDEAAEIISKKNDVPVCVLIPEEDDDE